MNKVDIREFFDHPVGRVFLRKLAKTRTELAEIAVKGKFYHSVEPNNELNRLIGKVSLIDDIVSGKLLEDEELDT